MPINYLAVVVAAIIGILFCWGYYWLFSKQWAAAAGMTDADYKDGPPPIAWIFLVLGHLLAAWMLAAILIYVGQVNMRAGIVAGALVWLGFSLPALAITYAFQKRPIMLTVIDAGAWLGILVVIGAVLGAFGR
jgi:hypothetical protein